MLRILLIILVALAVIIGLMRLTGAQPGNGAPAAADTQDVIEEAVEIAPADDFFVDEPAVDTLEGPDDLDGDMEMDPLDEPAAAASASDEPSPVADDPGL